MDIARQWILHALQAQPCYADWTLPIPQYFLFWLIVQPNIFLLLVLFALCVIIVDLFRSLLGSGTVSSWGYAGTLTLFRLSVACPTHLGRDALETSDSVHNLCLGLERIMTVR